MIGLTCILAQASDKSSRLLGEILPWLILLVGVVLAGAVLIYFIRRSLKDATKPSEGFTLQDLRDMHTTGELTDEEFERAKAMMIGRVRGVSGPAKPPDDAASPGNHEQS